MEVHTLSFVHSDVRFHTNDDAPFLIAEDVADIQVNPPEVDEKLEALRTPFKIKVPKRIKKFKANHECSICLKRFKSLKKCKELPCKHLFHKSCIYEWFKRSNTCPFCRKVVNDKDEKTDDSDDASDSDEEFYRLLERTNSWLGYN